MLNTEYCTDRYEGFVCISAAPELVVKEQSPQLPVLVLDVVLHCSLTRPAQLVRLLKMMLVHLNLFIVIVLHTHKKKTEVVFGVRHAQTHKVVHSINK